MAQLRQHYPEFEQHGAQIVAISSESQEGGAKLKSELDLPFPVLADADRQVIETYGVFHEDEPKGRAISRPATFVIDPTGAIRYRYVGEDAGDRPKPNIILQAVSEAASLEPGRD